MSTASSQPPTSDSPSATAHVAERYRRLAARFTDAIAAVPASEWSSPSPCDGWTAGHVVHHVVSSQHGFLDGMPFGDVPSAAPDASASPDELAACWSAVRGAVQAALDDPATASHSYDGFFGPTTFAATVEQFYCMDLLVHTWDLARAASLHEFEAMEPGDVEWAERMVRPLGDAVRMEGVFGPEVVLDDPDAASAQDRFLAWAGRRP